MKKPEDFWLYSGAFCASLLGASNFLDMLMAWDVRDLWMFWWELVATLGLFTIAYKLVRS